MADILKAKDGVYGAVVVALIVTLVGTQLAPEQIDKLYFCEAENTLRECVTLSSYGIPNASCTYLDENQATQRDICTYGGVRKPWTPANEYITLDNSSKIVIESLQSCTVLKYNETTYSVENVTQPENGSFVQEVFVPTIVEKENIVCEDLGYNITTKMSNYEIEGDCCGLRDIKGGYEISCKQIINGVCNPVCQQTSPIKSEYDEYCQIYTVTTSGITVEIVGDYDYVKDRQVRLSKFKEVPR